MSSLETEIAARVEQDRTLLLRCGELAHERQNLEQRQQELYREVVALIAERIWSEHPTWSRDRKTPAQKVDRMARHVAGELLLHKREQHEEALPNESA